MILAEHSAKIKELFSLCKRHRLKICTAESCTGGNLAHHMTHLPGSSDFFDQGFVTYSNNAKSSTLGIKTDIISRYGAVSFETALLMVKNISGNNIIAISTTGVVGPKSDEKNTDVGTVYIGASIRNQYLKINKFHFTGTRQEKQEKAVREAINLVIHMMKD